MAAVSIESVTPTTHLLSWREHDDSEDQARLSCLVDAIIHCLGPARCHRRSPRQLLVRADSVALGAQCPITLPQYMSLFEQCQHILRKFPLLGLRTADCLHLDEHHLILTNPSLLLPTPHEGRNLARVRLPHIHDLWHASHTLQSIRVIPATIPVDHIYDTLAQLLQSSTQGDFVPDTRMYYWLQQLQQSTKKHTSINTFAPLVLLF